MSALGRQCLTLAYPIAVVNNYLCDLSLAKKIIVCDNARVDRGAIPEMAVRRQNCEASWIDGMLSAGDDTRRTIDMASDNS
jgi:hypothetical protein